MKIIEKSILKYLDIIQKILLEKANFIIKIVMARIRKSLPDDIRRETKFFIEPFLNKEDGLLYYIDTKGFLVPI